MKKEQEILLNPEEIQQLLEGGLYWRDIQPKLSPENSDNFRRHLSIDEDSDIDEIKISEDIPKEIEEEKDVRAILLGEEKPIPLAAASEEDNTAGEEEIIKKRLFRYVSEEQATEVETESISDIKNEHTVPNVMLNNRDSLYKKNEFRDNEFKDIFNDDDEPEEERSPFGGLKLIILLAIVAAATFGFWYYFLTK